MFSWRGFANVKPKSSSGVMEVTLPLRSITYDVVSNPSHASARIMSFLNESDTIEGLQEVFISENENVILEGLDSLIFESDHLCNPNSSKEECSKYLKSLICEHFDSLKVFKFKI